MGNKILKILWIIIIFLFIALQIYNMAKANYADVVTGILTAVIILAMIIAYWLIARSIKPRVSKDKPADLPESNTANKDSVE